NTRPSGRRDHETKKRQRQRTDLGVTSPNYQCHTYLRGRSKRAPPTSTTPALSIKQPRACSRRAGHSFKLVGPAAPCQVGLQSLCQSSQNSQQLYETAEVGRGLALQRYRVLRLHRVRRSISPPQISKGGEIDPN